MLRGVTAALLANVLFSTGFTLEKRALSTLPPLNAGRPARLVLHLGRSPLWLAGALSLALGFAAQLAVYRTLPLVAAQGLFVSGLVLLLLLSALVLGERTSRSERYGIVAILLALVMIVFSLQDSAETISRRADTATLLLICLPALGAALGIFAFAERRALRRRERHGEARGYGEHLRRRPRMTTAALPAGAPHPGAPTPAALPTGAPTPAALPTGAPTPAALPTGAVGVSYGVAVGCLYGVSSLAIKGMAGLLDTSDPTGTALAVLTSPHLYLLLFTGSAGLVLSQTALQRCRASLLVPVCTTVTFLFTVAAGTVAYAEPLPSEPLRLVLRLGGAAVGVGVLLALARTAEPPGPPSPEHSSTATPRSPAERPSYPPKEPPMSPDDPLLKILACPLDKGPLVLLEAGPVPAALYNPRLRLRYPIVDGVPQLLPSSGERVTDKQHERLIEQLTPRHRNTPSPAEARNTASAQGTQPTQPKEPA